MLFTILMAVVGSLVYLLWGLRVRMGACFGRGKKEQGGERLPLVLFSDHKRYWNIFEPICDELERRGMNARSGLLENAVNPFTGNAVSLAAAGKIKTEAQHITISHSYDVSKNRGKVYEPAPWYTVTPGGETLFDRARWTLEPEEQ